MGTAPEAIYCTRRGEEPGYVRYYLLYNQEPGHIDFHGLKLAGGERGVGLFTSADRARRFQERHPTPVHYGVQEMAGPVLLALLRDFLVQGVQRLVLDPDPDSGRGGHMLLLAFLAAAEDEGESGCQGV